MILRTPYKERYASELEEEKEALAWLMEGGTDKKRKRKKLHLILIIIHKMNKINTIIKIL